MIALLPEDPFSLAVDAPPESVLERLNRALEVARAERHTPKLAGRIEGNRGILWLDGPFGGNAFRRRLRLRVERGAAGGTSISGSLAVHPRVRTLFGALMIGSSAFFVAGLYVAVNERTYLPFPFLLMPFALWGLRGIGLALSRAEEKRLCALVENAARLEAR